MSNKTNRVPVYFPSAVTAEHRSSNAFALMLVSVNWARQRTENIKDGIVLVSHTSWAAVKEHFRGTTVSAIQKILPARDPENLQLSYPPRNYQTNGSEIQKELWLNATRF